MAVFLLYLSDMSERPIPSSEESLPERQNIPLPVLSDNWERRARIADLFQSGEQQEYTADVVEGWKRGAEAYAGYARDFTMMDGPKSWSRNAAGRVFARTELYLFLREKPAMLQSGVRSDQEVALLAKYGIQCAGRYAYVPDLVEAVLRKHPDVFAGFPDSADGCMNMLAANRLQDMTLQRGLLLGYPEQSCRDFLAREAIVERPQKLAADVFRLVPEQDPDHRLIEGVFGAPVPGPDALAALQRQLLIHASSLGITSDDITQITDVLRARMQSRTVQFPGDYAWVDVVPNAESDLLQRRIAAALRTSGILEIDAAMRPPDLPRSALPA